VKAYIWPADMWACGHYRLIWPGEVIHASEPDFEVVIMKPTHADDDTGLRAWMEGDTVTDAACPDDADLVIFQRPSFPQLVKSIPFFRARGVAVVVDIDDDLSNIDPRNPAFTALHPDPHNLIPAPKGVDPKSPEWQAWVRSQYKATSPHSWLAIKEAAKAATLVTVSTPALTHRYGSGNAVVLPNCVPARFCDTPHEDSDLVGWPGSTHSHPGDLRILGNSIARLAGRGHRFKIVGAGPEAPRDLGVPDIDQTGPLAFEDWMENVSTLGVGVAPLADTVFNQAKSWLKPLELSAAGVPWVASPRVEYQRFHSLGAGALADRPKDWYRELARLCGDASYRQERSEEARSVARRLTIEEHAFRTAEVWHKAVEMERAVRPRVPGPAEPLRLYAASPVSDEVAASA
jgi:glycosyltransferase involved in cell wall biosynthesis